MKRRNFLKSAFAATSIIALPNFPATKSWAINGSNKGELSLVFFTDIHATSAKIVATTMNQAAQAFNKQKPDILIGGGDFISGGFHSTPLESAAHWEACKEMRQQIKGELFPTLGNHDLVGVKPVSAKPAVNPRHDFLSHFRLEKSYYSFDRLGYHFIVIDSLEITNDESEYRGFVDEEQLQWLKSDISEVTSSTPIILVSHVPLLTLFFQATKGGNVNAPKNRIVTNNLELLDVFAEKNLVLVLQGHLHVNEMIKWKKTTFITGGAICGGWWNGPWHGTNPGFGVINLSHNRVNWNYFDLQTSNPQSS